MNAQNSLLGFLNLGPNYGYELKKMYDQFFGTEKPILPGQVYSTLGRLQRDGKIKTITTDDDNNISAGPERIKYQITSQGTEFFQHWLVEPEKANPNLQTTLYNKVILALLSDMDATKFLDEQRHSHISRMRELTKQRIESTDLTKIILIDHAIYHIEADLRWIEATNSRISKIKEELCQISL